jgi:cephalosporin hydroxylase
MMATRQQPQLDAGYRARLDVWSDIVDWLPVLHDTVMTYPKAAVIELGVRTGNSTAALLAAAEWVDGHVWSVDVAAPRVPDWWQSTGRWTLQVGHDLDPAVLAAMPERCDVLFIDTSHHYDHTLAELRAYVPRVRPGGTVLMHDTELERPDGWTGISYPVRTAIEDYCAETGLTCEFRSGCYGLGVVHCGKDET